MAIAGGVEPPAPAAAEPPSAAWETLKTENEKLSAGWLELAQRQAQVEARAQHLNRIAKVIGPAEKVLAIRAKLLLAIIGAFVLSLYAMSWQTAPGLYVLIAWCLLTVIPLVYLEWSSGRARPPTA